MNRSPTRTKRTETLVPYTTLIRSHRRPLAPAVMLGARDDRGLGLVDAHAVQEMAVHDAAGADIGLVAGKDLPVLLPVGDDAVDRQRIFAREIQVALVVRRTAEDGAGAILHPHILENHTRPTPLGNERERH